MVANDKPSGGVTEKLTFNRIDQAHQPSSVQPQAPLNRISDNP